jgi:hypothetical protein
MKITSFYNKGQKNCMFKQTKLHEYVLTLRHINLVAMFCIPFPRKERTGDMNLKYQKNCNEYSIYKVKTIALRYDIA